MEGAQRETEELGSMWGQETVGRGAVLLQARVWPPPSPWSQVQGSGPCRVCCGTSTWAAPGWQPRLGLAAPSTLRLQLSSWGFPRGTHPGNPRTLQGRPRPGLLPQPGIPVPLFTSLWLICHLGSQSACFRLPWVFLGRRAQLAPVLHPLERPVVCGPEGDKPGWEGAQGW